MKSEKLLTAVVWLMAGTIGLPAAGPQAAPARAAQAGIRIVVIEGEDAVNIIQQKTAVAPIVEVRDRNDQPVAGAVVRFAIQGGRATFGGARTLTVTTNVAGRAAVTSLTPTASGVVQISASAAFEGQTAAVTIAQTNVLTAAQAASATAGGAGGGSGGATAGAGGAAGGGGGLSATTLALVGAAAGGGALVAAKTLGGGGTNYSGSFSGPLVLLFPDIQCPGSRTENQTGTLEMTLDVASDGAATGTAQLKGTTTVTATTATVNAVCGTGVGPVQVGTTGRVRPDAETQVHGTSTNLTFSGSESFNSPASAFDPGGSSTTLTATFSGALSGTEIAGLLTLTQTIAPLNRALVPGGGGGGSGTASFQVTLR